MSIKPPLLWSGKRAALGAGLALASAICVSAAEPPAGRLLAAQCAQCHGTDGAAVGGFESIRGENAWSMYQKLREMKNRPAESIMDLQARGFTDEQLLAIATYLAGFKENGESGEDEHEEEEEEEE
jgi:cytochrome c553